MKQLSTISWVLLFFALLGCNSKPKTTQALAAARKVEVEKKALHIRDSLYQRAVELGKAGNYNDAHIVLLQDDHAPEKADSAQLLESDLERIKNVESDILNLAPAEVKALKAGSYHSTYINLPIGHTWYNKEMLVASKRIPQLRAALEKKKREVAAKEAAERKKIALAEAAEARDKRASAAIELRNNFLDKGLNIKVKVEGKNKDAITLTYILFDEVWSYKMNQQGNIDQLLDLGFKKVRLTDGYDYGVTWTRKD